MTEQELPSNWGRWGEDDQLGTLNLIDDQARARAAAEVREGTSVSLARPITPTPMTTGMSPVGVSGTVPAPVMQVVNFNGFNPPAVTDSLFINTHNAALTHFDALAHMPVEGKVYPGKPLAEVVTSAGVRHGSADRAGEGILTRGVLLDLAPGSRLAAEDVVGDAALQSALERAGGARNGARRHAAKKRKTSTLHPGDAVVVRGGWTSDQPWGQPLPGLDLSVVRWLDERGASVYVGDIGDPRPPRFPMPMHHVALGRLGLPLVDAAGLDELAELCGARQRWSFMLVLAPPRITGTTGLPVNPLAIF